MRTLMLKGIKVLGVSAAFMGAPVAHADIIEITLQGDVDLLTGSDEYDLDGATFEYAYRYRTTAPPTLEDAGTELSTSRFSVISAAIRFSARPDGARDAVAPILGEYIEVLNWNSRPESDRLNTSDGSLLGGEFTGLVGPRTTLDLGSSSFFAEAGPVTHLPRLTRELVVGADADILTTNTSPAIQYDLLNVTILRVRTIPVPEPSTLALLGASLIGMGLARRREKA